jgi:hypothetical protein
MDLQQCMGLLRHESVKAWIETNHSSMLWVNTQKVYGIADWASSFSTKIIEYAGKMEYIMVLYHFCGNHPPSHEVSTVAVTVQAMIMQVLQTHHKKFVSRKLFPFTLEHFEDAAEDMMELWSLLISCIAEAGLPCVWLVIDNVDSLQKGSDWDFFISALQELSEGDAKLFKIFVTARGTGKETRAGVQKALADMSKDGQESNRVAIVTVPRAISRTTNSLYGKQKRPARLPDQEEESQVAAKANVDDLLNSGSDDEPWEDKKQADVLSHLVESPVSIKSSENTKGSSDDDDLSLSDSSLDFMKDDPLASSAESDWEKDSDGLEKDMEDVDLQDSDEDFLTKTKPKKSAKDDFDSDSSSDDLLLKVPKKAKGGKKTITRTAKKSTSGSLEKIVETTKKPQPQVSKMARKSRSDSSDSDTDFTPKDPKPVTRRTFDYSEEEDDEYGYI